MTHHIGIDLVYIPRFTRMQEETHDMTARMFTTSELAVHTTIESLAGVYAAKEAVLKAISPITCTLQNIQIEISKNGKPIVTCTTLDQKFSFTVSISHDGEYATAICIAEEQ